MKILFVTRLRGFFRHLLKSNNQEHSFSTEKQQIYETNSFKTRLKNRIGRSAVFDFLGIIQVITTNENQADIIGSFNRFVKTNKPYFIYVENPTALYHYRLNRGRSFLGRRKINKQLTEPNLKGLVFMSKACADTFERVCGKISENCHTMVIYPLVPENTLVTNSFIEKRCIQPKLKLLYIAQGMRFISKGGLEILEAIKILNKKGLDISIHIITSLNDLPSGIESKIRNTPNVLLDDFKFSFAQMQEIYASSHMLLQPTSDDSFNLTVLEGMKAGLPILASRLYAIPEMVRDNNNGYLCDPHYWFFNPNNIPNPEVWNHRKKTIYSGKTSKDIIEFLVTKISYLYVNRDELIRLSKNSLAKASTQPFNTEYIISQWNSFLTSLFETY